MTTPARNQVDLHCHTRRSDGLMEPRDLYDAARAYGMRLVAITDHDSVAGYRELRSAGLGAVAGPDGPELLAGVEINTLESDPALRRAAGLDAPEATAGHEELHILGLGVDAESDELEAALARQRDRRRARIERMAARLRDIGMPIDAELEQTLPPSVASAGRPHVARALVLAGHAESLDDAMSRLLAPGAPGWVPREGMGTREAIEIVGRAGGLPSLAHFAGAPQRTDLLRELSDMGLRGLEVYYRSFPEGTVTSLAAVAQALSLVPTGGSDYHGDAMTYAEAQDRTRVPLAVGEAVLAREGR